MQRRGNAPLIDLHAQNVLGRKRAIVNPNVSVALQVQNRLLEFGRNFAERFEEVVVCWVRLGMSEDHQATNVAAVLAQVAANPVQVVRVSLLPFGCIVDPAANNIQP